MKKLNVGIVTNMPPYSGGGRYAFELFRNLNKKIAAKLVYCGALKKSTESGIRIVKGGIKVPAFKRTINAYFYYPSRIPKFQLYHITNQLLTRVAKFKQPCVITILDLYFYKSKKSGPWLTRYLMNRTLKYLKNCKEIIAISKETKNDLVKLLGINPRKINVIYLGVDKKFFRRKPKIIARKKLNLPLNKKLILNLGSDNDYRKNIENVIVSFYEVQKKEPDSMLIRIGKSDHRITSLIKRLCLERKIIRIERVDEKAMPYYYSAADVYLCLDVETGFGLPLLESMACGTPVVCSKGGAFPEVVGKAGVLVNPNSVKKIAHQILAILSNDKLATKLSARGFKRIKNFSWKKMSDETVKVYERVMREVTLH